jgi:membrane-associated PAP2 superfamily phosphatase
MQAQATSRSGSTPDRTALATVLALALLLAWDAGGADLALARLVGDAQGFALRDDWLLSTVLHEGGRRAGWLLALALSLGVGWPAGPLRRLTTTERLRLAAGPLVAAAAVSFLKGLSPTSCPWDLREFGGLAQYLSHWQFSADGGGGHCFPAGHAAAGFSFFSGHFAFRERAPRVARAWLAGATLAGLVFGLGQQLRGAHFMSHTLWTAWLCWSANWLVHAGWPARPQPG